LALGGRLFPLTKQQNKTKKRPANDKISPLFVDCVSTGDQSGQAGNIQSRDFFPFEKRRVKVLVELSLILSVVYYPPTLFK
jgi:hypothetical protein